MLSRATQRHGFGRIISNRSGSMLLIERSGIKCMGIHRSWFSNESATSAVVKKVKESAVSYQSTQKPASKKISLNNSGLNMNVHSILGQADLNTNEPKDVFNESETKVTKKTIDSVDFNKIKPEKAIAYMYKAKKEGINLGVQHLVKGIKVCATGGKRDNKILDISCWAFDILKADNVVSIEVFESMMSIYSKFGKVEQAAALMEDFVAKGYSHTSYLLSTYIILLAKHGDNAQLEAGSYLYGTLKEVAQQKGFNIHPRVFLTMAERYCFMGESERVLTVLQDLTESNHEPSAELCEPLLAAALTVGDTAALRVLLSWYKSHFNIGLLEGQSTQVLRVAANSGDSQLALMAFQMVRDSGLEPEGKHYYFLLRALLVGQDLVSATELLQEMEHQGASCFTAASGQFDADRYASIKKLLVDNITQLKQQGGWKRQDEMSQVSSESKKRLDALYFALVEQMRNSKNSAEDAVPARVPRVVLDALVESAGRLGFTDKAFTIFQEYSTLFNTKPDINSYNALLSVCAARNSLSINTILTVFQDVETTCFTAPEAVGSRAVDQSFSALVEAITTRRQFQLLDQVIEHMLANRAQASPKVLHNAALGLANAGLEHWELVDKIRGILLARRLGMPRDQITHETALQLAHNKDLGIRLTTVFEKRLIGIKEKHEGDRESAQSQRDAV